MSNTTKADTLKMLYNDFINAYDWDGDYNQFRDNLKDEDKRKILYDEMNKAYDLESRDFESFNNRIEKFYNPDENNIMPGQTANLQDGDIKYKSETELPKAELNIEEEDAEGLLENQMRENKEEGEFKDWYAVMSGEYGLDPDPNHPDHYYDYKAAWKAGVQPEMYENEQGEKEYHWPSQFKADNHPNRYMYKEYEGNPYIVDTKKEIGIDINQMSKVFKEEYGFSDEEIESWKKISLEEGILDGDTYIQKVLLDKVAPDREDDTSTWAKLQHDSGNLLSAAFVGMFGLLRYTHKVGAPGCAAQVKTGVDLWEAGELPTMEEWFQTELVDKGWLVPQQTRAGELALTAIGKPMEWYEKYVVQNGADFLDKHTESTLWGNAYTGLFRAFPYLAIAKGKYNQVQKAKTGVNPSLYNKITKNKIITEKSFPNVRLDFGKFGLFAKSLSKKDYKTYVTKMSESLGMTKQQFINRMKKGGETEVNFVRYIETFDKPWFFSLKKKMGVKSDYNLGVRISNKEIAKVKNNGITVGGENILPPFKQSQKIIKQRVADNKVNLQNITTALDEPVAPFQKITPQKLATVGAKTTTIPANIAETAKSRIAERKQKAELDAKNKQKSIIKEQIDIEEAATGKPSKLREVNKSIDKDIKKLEAPKTKPKAAEKPITKTETAIASKDAKIPNVIYRGSKGNVSELKSTGKERVFDGGDNPLTLVKQLKNEGVKGADKIKTWADANKFISNTYKKDYDFIKFNNSSRPQLGDEYIQTSTGKSFAKDKSHAEVYAKSTGRDKKYIDTKAETSPVELKNRQWSKVKPASEGSSAIQGMSINDKPYYVQIKTVNNKRTVHQVDLNGKSLGVLGNTYGAAKSKLIKLYTKGKLAKTKKIDATKLSKKYSDNPELNKMYIDVNETIPNKIANIKANKTLSQSDKKALIAIQDKAISAKKLEIKQFKDEQIKSELQSIEESRQVAKSIESRNREIRAIKDEMVKYKKKFGKDNMSKIGYLKIKEKELQDLTEIQKTLSKFNSPQFNVSIIPGLPELISSIGKYIKKAKAKDLNPKEIRYIKTTIDKFVKNRESIKKMSQKVKDIAKPQNLINKIKNIKSPIMEPDGWIIDFEKALIDVNSSRNVAYVHAENAAKPIYEFIKENKIKPERMRTLLDAMESGAVYNVDNFAVSLSAPVRPSAKNNNIVVVDVSKLNKLWKNDKGYYFKKGDYDVRESINKAIESGGDMEAPIIGFASKGGKKFISFTDGRHRFAQIRDKGGSKIAVSIKPEDLAELQDLGLDVITSKPTKNQVSPNVLFDYPSITPKEIKLMETYRTLLDDAYEIAVREGIAKEEYFINNYVRHIVDLDKNKGTIDYQLIAKKLHTKPSFTKQRHYMSLKDLEEAGFVVNPDMVHHIQQYYNSLYKAIGDKKFVEYLTRAETPDNMPLISHHHSFLNAGYKERNIPGLGSWYTYLDDNGVLNKWGSDKVYVNPDIVVGLDSFLKQGIWTQIKQSPSPIAGKPWFAVKRLQKRLTMMNPVHHGVNIASDVFVETTNSWGLPSISKTLKFMDVLDDNKAFADKTIGTSKVIGIKNDFEFNLLCAECGLNTNYVSGVAENMRLSFNENFQDLNTINPKDLKGMSVTALKKVHDLVFGGIDKLMWEKIVGNSAKNMFLMHTMKQMQNEGYISKGGDLSKLKLLKPLPSRDKLVEFGKVSAAYTNNNLGLLPDIVFSEGGGLAMDLGFWAKNWTAGWQRQLMFYPSNLGLTSGKLVKGGYIKIGNKKFNPFPRHLQWKGQTDKENNYIRDLVGKHWLKSTMQILFAIETGNQIMDTWNNKDEITDLKSLITLGGKRRVGLFKPGLALKNRLQVQTGIQDKTKPNNELYLTLPFYKYQRDIMLMFQFGSPEKIGEHLWGKTDAQAKILMQLVNNQDWLKNQKIRHPGASWAEQSSDLLSFVAHRFTPWGQWTPEEGYAFNQFRKWTAITGLHVASVPRNSEAMDLWYEVAQHKDYEKIKLDKYIMEKVLTGHFYSTEDEDGNVTKGAWDIILDNPDMYEDAYTKIENLHKRHNNPLGIKFATASKRERINFVNVFIDIYGIDKWNKLSEEYDLGHFVEEGEE